MRNTEIRSITPEGGDVRIEEVDLDAERAKLNSADMEIAATINGLIHEYDDLIAEASLLLEEHGKDEDLQVSLSGLSDIIQGAAHSRLKLKARVAPGTSIETMLAGKSLEELKDGHEYAIESMRKRVDMMKTVAGATDRQDRLEDARERVDEAHSTTEVEIAKGIIDGKPVSSQEAQEADQQERDKALEAARKKLDLRSAIAILDDLRSVTPPLAGEGTKGIAKLLDGDGRETFKASLDMTENSSEMAARLSKRLSSDRDAFLEAGVDAGQLRKVIYALESLAEDTKRRANEIAKTGRGVKKQGLGVLREQTDRLNDAKLLISPSNVGGQTIRGGKSVDSTQRLKRLREDKVY